MRLLIEHKLRGRPYPLACGGNMDLVLSKLKKEASTNFTSFQNKYLKANSRKSHLLTRSYNALHVNVGRGDQLNSRKYEELLRILIDHKWTFEDYLLNNLLLKIHILARISKYMPLKKLRSTMKVLGTICILFTNLGNS